MKISREIYNQIINMQRRVPPETGGILGEHKGIITVSYFDKGLESGKMCSYVPDIKRLNGVIKEWQQKNILFRGIYHTHFGSVSTFSQADKIYMEKILINMPDEIEQLYFPLVLMPERQMICYIAKIEFGKLIVAKEHMVIIENDKRRDKICKI